MHDYIFRPRSEPARTLYDALQAEAKHRKGRTPEQWMDAEQQAVWRAARDYAQQHGLAVPTIDAVRKAERLASGHTDYGLKWALGVAQALGH